MSWYHGALAGLAAFALFASWHVPRCGKWILILVVNYVTTVAYFRTGINGAYAPPPLVVAFFCDAICFVIIRQGHEDEWEFWTLGTIMLGMATLDGVMFMGMVVGFPPMIPMWLYGSIQEIANAAYLLLIGGIGLADWLHKSSMAGRHRTGLVASLNTVARRRSQVSKIKLK